jgi:hypothetical protein
VDQGLKEVGRILKSNGKFVIIKDTSVPGAEQALDTLTTRLESAGYIIRDKRQIKADDVSFYLLICEIENS